MPSLLRSRRIRWVAPVLVVAVIGLIAVVPTLSAGATDAPTLPSVGAQALLAKALAAKADNLPGLSGTVRLTVNMGIPDLSQFGGAVGPAQGFDPTSLLSGAHSADISVSKDGFSATYSDSLTSVDRVIANHTDVWIWQSHGTKVTHIVLPADQGSASGSEAASEAGNPVKTPGQIAQSLLASLAPSSDVSVSAPIYVAHRAAYELVLAPKDPASTVDHVAIAVDSATGLPTRVQIFAKGQAAVAFGFGFTRLNVGPQNPANFTFTPPPNAHVTTKVLHAGHPAQPQPPAPSRRSGGPTVVGHDWTAVTIFHGVQLPPEVDGLLQRAAIPAPGGNGRIFSTALVNVLLLDNGNVAVGAVSADALVKAAAPFAG